MVLFISAKGAEAGLAGYAVRAVLPENQVTRDAMYFDLNITPGLQQTLQVVVMNRGSEAIDVAVEACASYSNANGVIEFSDGPVTDSSMLVDFSQIAVPVEPLITVPAEGEAIAEFVLTAPTAPFEGSIYGGFLFTAVEPQEEAAQGGMAIRNIFRYAIGVLLRGDPAVVEPAFELLGAETAETPMPSLALHLRNPKPRLIRDIALEVDVCSKGGGDSVLTFARQGVDMAPNSAMPYTLYFDETNPKPAPGEYRVKVKLNYQERVWQWETGLTVE